MPSYLVTDISTIGAKVLAATSPPAKDIKRERHRVARCQVGSRSVVQAAEQTAHPLAVRAGGRVLPQIGVLKSVNIPKNHLPHWTFVSGLDPSEFGRRLVDQPRHLDRLRRQRRVARRQGDDLAGIHSL